MEATRISLLSVRPSDSNKTKEFWSKIASETDAELFLKDYRASAKEKLNALWALTSPTDEEKRTQAELEAIIPMLQLKVPTFLVLNKIDLIDDPKEIEQLQAGFAQLFPKWKQYLISAKQGTATDALIPAILEHLPEAPAYYPEDALSDRPVRFFVSELIREQIYNLYHEEIPYHTAVIIQSFEEKATLTVIKAEIIVTRETQKMILLGKGGSNIKQLGIRSREKIEAFIDGKVHLELFIKVRPKWRDNDNYLKEYGYHN